MANTRPHVARLLRYPVKGLTPQPLPGITLKAGEAVPLDRAETGRLLDDVAGPGVALRS